MRVGDAATTSPKRDELAASLLLPMGADGVYARTALYEHVVGLVDALISTYRERNTETLRLPPVMSRRDLETSGYLDSFPNLLGCVCALHGSEAEIGQAVRLRTAGDSWTTALAPTDLVLTPAACYPLYPIAAARGALPADGLLFDVTCECFRREPSQDLDRLQSFRMREYVRMGMPEEVLAFRAGWMSRGEQIARDLGLVARVEVASDPFFGREGQIKAVSQMQQTLKFELLVPMLGAERPTACMSFNYHRDHFGTTWSLHDSDGGIAHTGCVAFGLDRLTVGLFWAHGLDLGAWPAEVRTTLGI